jgi:pimeloyl-ACP methyl ester carboxylesterase
MVRAADRREPRAAASADPALTSRRSRPAAGAPDDRPAVSGRARRPDARGIAPSGDGWVAWEAFGSGDPPIVFVPPWQIVHSRVWKAQVPDFARRHRVVTWDARGNGRSDRPRDPAAHTVLARSADLGRVMDAARIEEAVLVGLSSAGRVIVAFAAERPERVRGIVLICPGSPFGVASSGVEVPFEEPLPDDTGWNKENVHFWRRDFRAYLEHFFAEAFPEPHSTKQREDGVRWGLDTDPETLAATVRAPSVIDGDAFRAMCSGIACPTLVIQGTDERISHVTQGAGLAHAIPGARLELIEGGGHIPSVRDPIAVNLAIRRFIRLLPGAVR